MVLVLTYYSFHLVAPGQISLVADNKRQRDQWSYHQRMLRTSKPNAMNTQHINKT